MRYKDAGVNIDAGTESVQLMKTYLHLTIFAALVLPFLLGCASTAKLEKQLFSDNDSIRVEALHILGNKLPVGTRYKVVHSLINRAKYGKQEESIKAFKLLADADYPLDLSRPYTYGIRSEAAVKYESLVCEIRDVDSSALNSYLFVLSHGDSRTMAWVASILGEVTPARTTICNSLLQVLQDSDTTVQEAAMISLRRMRKQYHADITSKLSEGNLRAAYILAGMEQYDPEVFCVASININSKDRSARSLAMQTLLMCTYGIDSTKMLLTKTLLGSSSAMREAALRTVKDDRYLNKATLELITIKAKGDDSEAYHSVGILMNALPTSLPYITQLLSSSSVEKKKSVINALFVKGINAEQLRAIMSDDVDSLVLFNMACIILSNDANDEKTKEMISAILRTKNNKKVYIAELRLYPHLIPLFGNEILPLLLSDDESVTNEAVETVYTMHLVKVQGPPSHWRDTQQYRDTLAETKFKDDAFVLTEKMLMDKPVKNRAIVAGNMYQFGSRATPILCNQIRKETDEEVIMHAYRSLSMLRPKDSVTINFLIEQLHKQEKHIIYISNVIAYIGKPAVATVEHLIPFIDDPEKDVRKAVISALKRIDSKEAKEAVIHYQRKYRE